MSDQNRCRYRSHSAGNRCYGVYNRLYCREIHVTAQFPFRVHIDADIDDGLSFPDIIRADHTGTSCRDNDQVRVSGDRGHIFGPCMANRDRSVLLDQHHCGGLADDQAPADDDRLFAGAVIAIMIQDLHAGLGRTGWEADLLACKDAGHG